MSDLSTITLTDAQIKEIDYADLLYRRIDLEKFALIHEQDLLNNCINLLSTLIIVPNQSRFHDLKRVSINKKVNADQSNTRLKYVHELKYPPDRVKDKLYYNRASYKRQSIFYGGFGEFQALFENPPEQGDLYTISTWHQKENTELSFASIFQDEIVQQNTDLYKNEWLAYKEQISKLEENTRAALEKLFSLITFFFTRPVDQLKRIEYIYSAHLANKIFNMNCDPKIEAIEYPSVPMRYAAINLAILPSVFDAKFEFSYAKEFILLNDPKGKHQWSSAKTGEANGHFNGELHWIS